MLRNLSTVATIGMLLASSALAQTCDKSAAAKSTCATKATQVADTKKSGCCASGSKAALVAAKSQSTCSSKDAGMPAEMVLMQKIAKHGGPAMTFKVGDKDTCCPFTAEKMAAESKSQMQFVVGKTTYMTKADAKAAYGAELERYLEDLTTVQFAIGDDCTRCPMTAKKMAKSSGKAMHYRLGSFDFEDMKKAEALAVSAKKAAGDVKLAAMVGAKEYTCSTTAGKVAKAEGKSLEYKVGAMKTTCSKTADLNLKLAKVDAALSTIAAAQG